jgi:hypothetical protein
MSNKANIIKQEVYLMTASIGDVYKGGEAVAINHWSKVDANLYLIFNICQIAR